MARSIGFTATERQGVLETICLVHEYRHFQQDFILGVGAWDYLYRNAEIERTLGLIKQINGFREVVGYDLSEIRKIDKIPLLHRDEKSEVIDIKAEANRLNIPTEIAGLFTVRRLLELDAATYTNNVVFSTKWKEQAIDHLPDLSNYYSFTDLPGEYTETFFFILKELDNYFDSELQGSERMDFIISILRLLVFLSLCHPDPTIMKSRGLTQFDCLPGVRLLRMAQAFTEAWGKDNPTLKQFEKCLYRETGYDYPILDEYAQGWVEFLDNFSQRDWFTEYSKIRSKVIAERFLMTSGSEATPDASYHIAMQGEPLEFAVTHGLPLASKNLDGTPSPITLTNLSLSDGRYDIDRTRHANAWRLADFFQGKSPKFHCIFGDAGLCSVKRPVCKLGFESPAQIPRDDACRVSVTVHDETKNVIKF